MSLLRFFKKTNTEHEPPAKHLCRESRESQADLEEAANAHGEEPCEKSPESDCDSDCAESTSSSARSTSSKQSRRFRKVWLVGREQWLEYSRQEHGMFCSAAATTENIVAALNHPVSARGMEQAFYCLYFLAKQRIPHATNYEPLLDLISLLGVDIK